MNTGYIYKLVSNFTDNIYIGSTTKKYLSERLASHKYDYNKWIKNKINYISSFELFKLGDVIIECLEIIKYDDKQTLWMAEGKWQKQLKCINLVICGRTRKEHSKDKSIQLAKKCKEWRNINPIINCECGCQVSKSNISRHLNSKKHLNFKEK